MKLTRTKKEGKLRSEKQKDMKEEVTRRDQTRDGVPRKKIRRSLINGLPLDAHPAIPLVATSVSPVYGIAHLAVFFKKLGFLRVTRALNNVLSPL
jgi:hypothetical protein